MTTHYYIGLMSGTSLDSIDAVLVKSTSNTFILIDSLSHPIDAKLKQIAITAPTQEHISWQDYLYLDVEFGRTFAKAANALIQKHPDLAIRAIGSHGQTLFHAPSGTHPSSIQLGDANIIASQTGVTTVNDFRRRDIALGGQGAPLVPAFHQAVFKSETTTRIILNIGGIANISVLKPTEPTYGYDSGPGNMLMDAWIKQHKNKRFDKNGQWAQSGAVIPELLATLLQEPFFKLISPKSTGRELFNLSWLRPYLKNHYTIEDIQATLLALTCQSISDTIKREASSGEIYLCGGGTHNHYLIKNLEKLLPTFTMQTTSTLGIDPDWVEAVAFAWLAKQTLEKKHSNLPKVTGAKKESVLGGVYYP
ncbi:anhydro-N-acetylmuramic acid kinase [Piscirickettsia salmonis]|uniref:anhydro-N-acetylmuramic acid kinase n=1 Tax=Piscirickettsia salmonis TaxID=1238 RepID=UPI0007C89A2F|nr:Anhydro-N-acetylmuramic acid kinase [Piscirickettsiaceae bacterium NZ-RLO1]